MDTSSKTDQKHLSPKGKLPCLFHLGQCSAISFDLVLTKPLGRDSTTMKLSYHGIVIGLNPIMWSNKLLPKPKNGSYRLNDIFFGFIEDI